MKPLRDLVVVEFAGSVAGAYCAKLFADQGATVHLVGDRKLPDFQQIYFDELKTSVDMAAVDMAEVDVVIESDAHNKVETHRGAAPQAQRVQISPFGMTGARSHWRSTDLVDYAISGHSYLYGHPDREPLRGPPEQPAIAAGLFAFVGAMAGLHTRERLGHGQVIDVSHHDVMAALHQFALVSHLVNGHVLCRRGNRYTGQGQPNGPYPCLDGWVSIACVTIQQIETLVAVAGLGHLLEHPDVSSPLDLQMQPHILDAPLRKWLAQQRVDELVELLQTLRVPAAPVRNTGELLHDPQLVDRQFFRTVRGNDAVQVPQVPFTLSHVQRPGASQWVPGDLDDGPLAGLRVLDMARVWAGPLCTRILADLGAEVDWVEAPWSRGPLDPPQSFADATHFYPDDELGERPWNRNAHWIKYGLGKRSLSLDLQSHAGQQTFARLVPRYHVLVENFSSRVMPQFGFDEQALHDLNPDLINVTMPGFGRSGPAEHWLAYGSSVDSHAGLSSLIGYPDQVPWKGGVAWPDPLAGLHACSAILTALWSGRHHGTGGLTIESAQFESTVAAIGDRVVQAQIDEPYRPHGNREADYLAQGVYRCGGDDEWLAISMRDAVALAAVHEVLELGGVADGSHDELDAKITEATLLCSAADLAARLQAAGVAAGPVNKAPDVVADEHLASRDFWATVEQADVGEFTAPRSPVGLVETPAAVRASAPTLGEQNAQILSDAGFDGDEIEALSSDGIITVAPPR